MPMTPRGNFTYWCCVKAVELSELIASKNRGSYALSTILGWCTVGPMYRQNKSEKFSCNRIMVISVVQSLLYAI